VGVKEIMISLGMILSGVFALALNGDWRLMLGFYAIPAGI
jgi:hypothetical protein